MTWLVTGGAGYIGAHVVDALQRAGLGVVVLDDLRSGRREFVPAGAALVVGDIADPAAIGKAFDAAVDPVVGLIHVAGLKYAGVSVTQPSEFYRVNVEGTRALYDECLNRGVHRIVFSSSAAVYGTPDVDLVDESTPVAPESPYGETKLIGEWLLADLGRQRDLLGLEPLRHLSLRYFNVVGSGLDSVYDVSPHNLFPLVVAALAEGRAPAINGADYPTPDGTCVRDYLHVADVAAAHVAAARLLLTGPAPHPVINLGRGEGVSVRQIVSALQAAAGNDLKPIIGARRPGDPARIVTSAALARADLGWSAEEGLDSMVRSAVRSWEAARRSGTAALAAD